MTAVVGVVGATGAVGRAVVGWLVAHGHARVRAGARDVDAAARLHDDTPDRVTVRQVDVDDPASLAEFAEGCAVVVCCAGPSVRVLDRVAVAADTVGAHYVDPGGDERLRRTLAGRAAGSGRTTAVLAAGMTPGLSGVLLRCAATGFDAGASAEMWSGGLGPISWAAAEDYLTVSDPDVGRSFAAWRDGRTVPGSLRPVPVVEVPGFGGAASAQPYLSVELARVAARQRLACLDAYTVFDGDHLAGVLATSGRVTADDVVRAAALDSAGLDPYQAIVVHVRGTRDGAPAARALTVHAGDASALTGAVAGITAGAVLSGGLRPGVYTAAGVLDPAATLSALADAGTVRVSTVDTSPEDLDAVEEGAL